MRIYGNPFPRHRRWKHTLPSFTPLGRKIITGAEDEDFHLYLDGMDLTEQKVWQVIFQNEYLGNVQPDGLNAQVSFTIGSDGYEYCLPTKVVERRRLEDMQRDFETHGGEMISKGDFKFIFDLCYLYLNL